MRTRTGIWRDVLLYTAVWTALGLFSFAEFLATASSRPVHRPWPSALGATMLDYYTTGIATPIYVWLVRRFPIAGPRIGRTVLLYVVVMAACVVLKWVVYTPLDHALFHRTYTFLYLLVNDSFGVVLAQLIFIVLLIAIEWYRAARQAELRASTLAAQLSSAQLDALRSQLDPHFLFNTLNGISALMHRDVRAADTMLSRLSDMLRLTLDSTSAQEVPLRTELETTRLYLDIMDARFGDRLSWSFDVGEPLLDERVPSFLLQPLVENVVRHGIHETNQRTTIGVSAAAAGDTLSLRIADDGRGLPPAAGLNEGIGLRNTRRRLAELYGAAAQLEVTNRDGGGTEVIVTIPRRVGLVAP
ncbi:MAG TPA: histidine kinase [Candidatus Elarobacter sp.]|jgi:sensor histidine kinase YesM|nr:histidine kinase [Candidatus Elarobacter sp.]